MCYLNRPDLVRVHESHLESVGAPIVSEPAPRHVATDIVKEVAPVAIEPTVAPMDILVTKPNFWTFRGDLLSSVLAELCVGQLV